MAYNKNTGLYEGHIYLITNNINGKCYVGQTIRTIEIRFKQHCNSATDKNKGMLIPRAIAKYGKENFSIEQLDKFASTTKEDLKSLLDQSEIKYIQKYNTLTPNGYNLTKGGNSPNIMALRPVDQYSKDGEFIKSWSSITEASQILGLSSRSVSAITGVCSGYSENKTSYGYVWRYKGEAFEKFGYKNKDRVEIYCFDLDGNLIKKYNSRSEIRKDYRFLDYSIVDDPYHQMCDRWWSTKPKFGYLGIPQLKKVDLYDRQGNFIKTFNSVGSCAEYIGVKDQTSVSGACLGRNKTVMGYIARYHGEAFDKYDTGKCNSIDVYDINKQYICSFDDIEDAIILDGLPKKIFRAKGGIRECCDGKRDQQWGYIFRYKGENLNKYCYNLKAPHGSCINQYDLDGNFITVFDNINAILDFYKTNNIEINRKNIEQCLRGASKSAYGFRWYYQHYLQNPDQSRIRTRLNQTNSKAIEYIKNQKLSQAS